MSAFVPLAVWADGEVYSENLPLRPANTILLPRETDMLKVAEVYRTGTNSSPWNSTARHLLAGVLITLSAFYIERGDWDATVAASTEAGDCLDYIQQVDRDGMSPSVLVATWQAAIDYNNAVLCALDGDFAQARMLCSYGTARLGPVTPTNDEERTNRNLVAQSLVVLALDLVDAEKKQSTRQR